MCTFSQNINFLVPILWRMSSYFLIIDSLLLHLYHNLLPQLLSLYLQLLVSGKKSLHYWIQLSMCGKVVTFYYYFIWTLLSTPFTWYPSIYKKFPSSPLHPIPTDRRENKTCPKWPGTFPPENILPIIWVTSFELSLYLQQWKNHRNKRFGAY